MRAPLVRRTRPFTFLLVLAVVAAGLFAPSAAAGARYAGYVFFYFTGEGTADGRAGLPRRQPRQRPAALGRAERRPAGAHVRVWGTRACATRSSSAPREGDRFYLIATDLRIHGNGDWDAAQRFGSKHIEVWESTDLVHWSAQRHVAGLAGHGGQHVGAGGLLGPHDQRLRRVLGVEAVRGGRPGPHRRHLQPDALRHHQRDFRTFSEPQVWVDPGHSVIDSTVVEHRGRYYRFTKDERSARPGRAVRQVHRRGAVAAAARHRLRLRGGLHRRRRHQPRRGADGVQVQHREPLVPVHRRVRRPRLRAVRVHRPRVRRVADPVSDYELPARPRHGTVLPVTKAELDRVRAAHP